MPEGVSGVRLQDFLARTYPAVRRAMLRGIQARGGIKVNGMRANRDLRLRAFDYVEVAAASDDLAPRVRRSEPLPLNVLFASPTCLVIDKPAGLATVPDRTGADRGVHGRLAELRPDGDLRIAHRLDRNTSGCLVLADGIDAARHFDAQFSGRQVEKVYLALIEGRVTFARRTIDRWLGSHPRRPGKVVAAAKEQPGFRAAVTHVERVDMFGQLSLVRLRPETGRTHQLRVHLAAIGHPIVGDVDYGGRPLLLSEHKRGYKLRRGVPERPLLQRMFLHSESIACNDVDGTAVAVRAPLPEDLQTALARLAAVSGRAPERG